MKHPLCYSDGKSKELRKTFYALLKTSFTIPEVPNFIFVCGGNKNSIRRKFQAEFKKLLPQFNYFEPEFAIDHAKRITSGEQSNLTEFEELIAGLAHSVIIFPEAPGSFAELGSFSKTPNIAQKSLAVLNIKFQADESFINLGPVALLDRDSIFKSALYLNYDEPDFDNIKKRLAQKPLSRQRKDLEIRPFDKNDTFSLFALIQILVKMMVIATIDDIAFLLRGLFGRKFQPTKAKEVISILEGAGYITKAGGVYGHLKYNPAHKLLLAPKDSKTTKLRISDLGLRISQILFSENDEVFKGLLERASLC